MSDSQFPHTYSPITERDFELPEDQNVAVWVVINVEHDRADEPVSTPIYEGTSTYTPDVFNYGWREYGLRVGIWRMVELFEKHDVPATIALNADVCDYEPEIVAALVDRAYEFIGHGRTNAERLAGMAREEERAVIRETRQRIEDATGKRPTGWLGPGLTETFNTLDLLAQEGFEYVADWSNDDQPYPMNPEGGDLVAVPYTVALNDVTLLVKQGMTPWDYERMMKDQFDVLYEEGKHPGNAKIMAITTHPYLLGQPFCKKYFDNVLEYVTQHRDVWVASGGEIAEYYHQNY